jgi:N-acetylmuramic acid 6-phosphate etherase
MKKILGIDGGGTRTAWMLLKRGDEQARSVSEGKLPPSNLRLTRPEQIISIFRQMPTPVDRVGAFLAGCGTEDDRRKLAKICREVWPEAKIITGSDRDSGFAAAFGGGDGIAVNAGTGSSIMGRRGERTEQAGGWGHILGDAGSGYFLALQTLRLVLREYDLHRRTSELAKNILGALGLNNLDELVRWAQTAGKIDVALLAPIVFAAVERGDVNVGDILRSGALVLAEYTRAVADRLDFRAPPIRLLGGLFRRQSIYVEAFRRELSSLLPDSEIAVAENRSEFGAAWLASAETNIGRPREILKTTNEVSLKEIADALTEEQNPRSSKLDQLTALEFVQLFVEEENFVQDALRGSVDELARALEIVTDVLKNGGRLFYVGAGTSGRLGVLDASEIPPTFGASSELVQGIIAGGATALHRSIEGAEDEPGAGAVAVEERGVTSGDIVCGITASGRTPFVLGALERAKALGAQTILLSCNPSAHRADLKVDLRIDLPTGPELLTGSTRLKAGTATKVALNILSTGAMVRLGRVQGNLMIDLNASNAKLRDRAARLLAQLAGCDYEVAMGQLREADWNLRAALTSAAACDERPE